ncbi:TlpA disulfide reductase family protein [Jiulongibacter sediminis]|jgi:thiol-disulfide isomerase/thioredoxin|uniref:TlpA family protein disulfide reductase n=1 Tax=Jiulongibacter sediminis TaxID=1605367 RepID=UPI0026EACD3F|nr:TlpA disulfide reductase family protein [Jiulongibacter sediminis]
MKRSAFLFLVLFSFLNCSAKEKFTFISNRAIDGPINLKYFELLNGKPIELGSTNLDINNIGVLETNINQDKLFCFLDVEGNGFTIFLNRGGEYDIEINFNDTEPRPTLLFSGTNAVVNQLLQDQTIIMNKFTYDEMNYLDWSEGQIIPGFTKLRDSLQNHNQKILEVAELENRDKELILNHLESNFESVYYNFLLARLDHSSESYKGFLDELAKTSYRNELIDLKSYSYKMKLRMHYMTEVSQIVEADSSQGFINPLINYINTTHSNTRHSDKAKEYIIADIIHFNIKYFSLEQRMKILSQFQEWYPESQYSTDLFKVDNELKELENDPTAPSFYGTDKNNKTVSLEDFKGKWLYVDIWATWCGPCIEEIPSSKAIQDELSKKENLVFLNLSVDSNKDNWNRYLEKNEHFSGTHLLLNQPQISELNKNYKLSGVPHYLLISPDGILVENNAPRPSDPKTLELLRNL